MNNEPVAWLSNDSFEISSMESNKFPIPLYTHPAKTLTDEEFDRIFADGKRLGVLETEDKFLKEKTLTDEEIDDIGREHLTDGDGAIEFARAILKKASEK
jgi:hypothetical protein